MDFSNIDIMQFIMILGIFLGVYFKLMQYNGRIATNTEQKVNMQRDVDSLLDFKRVHERKYETVDEKIDCLEKKIITGFSEVNMQLARFEPVIQHNDKIHQDILTELQNISKATQREQHSS